ncbi:MAG TPA: hypothetical protein VEQ40_08445, partial [Pyrinomonadaceae bacterium]|nr:hypothetical protein [Pyrinomonadaceae bacterium]
MKAKFVDYRPRHARKHAAELDPAGDARLFTEPEPIDDSPERLERLRKQISEVQSATCNAYAVIGLPLKLRPLVDTILAASEGQTHFQASQKVLVELLFQQGDGRTYAAKKSDVRRMLNALTKWQEQTKRTLCTIRPGGRTRDEQGEDGYEYHDTEFDLVFIDAIAKAMMRNPQPDRMRAAVQVEISEMMKLPPFDGRWRVKPPTPQQLQERNAKAGVTKIVNAATAELDLPAGGDPFAYLDRMYAIAKQQLEMEVERRASAPSTSYQEGASEKLSDVNTQVEWVGGVSDPTHPPLPSQESESDSSQDGFGAEIAPKDKESKVLISEDVPAPDVEPSPAAKAAWRDL